ncbi:unnamed protein product [Effrenium voratum]|nr:unnamed protein product [Effrenium voratum]CAJ1442217.1 unnamed protein product [Effrenium voratum]
MRMRLAFTACVGVLAWDGLPETEELREQGRRTARWLPCRICAERASSLLSVFKEEIEKLYWEDETWADKLTDKLSNTRRLWSAQTPSSSFVWPRARVSEDAIRHDNFHSKSYAVQRACLAAFDDMELIAEAVAKAYEGAKKSHASDVQLLMTLNKAARQACQMTPACLAERELRSRPSHEEL